MIRQVMKSNPIKRWKSTNLTSNFRRNLPISSVTTTTATATVTTTTLRSLSSAATPVEDYYRHGVDTNAATRMCLSSILDENDPKSHELYRYEIDFQVNCNDVQYVQEGGFVVMDEEEMESVFPTGVAGELEGNSFMVRDSSKLVCRYVVLYSVV